MSLNEDAFLSSLLPTLQQSSDVAVPPGDDAAVVTLPDGSQLLAAVDQLIEAVHYDASLSPEDIGRKLLARNLSDIAAMGGAASHAMVTLAVDASRDDAWLNGVMKGITDLASQYAVSVIGGDVSSSRSTVLTLSILGRVQSRAVERSSAKPGQLIYCTGHLGLSNPSGHHYGFSPRIEEGQLLAASGLASAMMDISDGLVKDLSRLCLASDCAAQICKTDLPLREWGGRAATADEACYDGEDYELLFTVDSGDVGRLSDEWPFDTQLTCIGEIKALEPASSLITDESGGDLLDSERIFEHFRGGERDQL